MLGNTELIPAAAIIILSSLLLYLFGSSFSRSSIPIMASETRDHSSDPDWLSIYDKRTLYDESEIVRIVTELYEVLIRLCYVSADDISFAPPEGRALNQTLHEELHLDPAVISLLRRLPLPKDRDTSSDLFIFPGSRAFCLLDSKDLRNSRHPSRGVHVLPQDILLTEGGQYGNYIALDVRENTIRVIENYMDNNYRTEDERHAPSFLQQHVNRIKALNIVPRAGGGTYGKALTDENDEAQPQMKKILIEKYGWPDNFRRDEWKEEQDAEWDKVQDVFVAEWKNDYHNRIAAQRGE